VGSSWGAVEGGGNFLFIGISAKKFEIAGSRNQGVALRSIHPFSVLSRMSLVSDLSTAVDSNFIAAELLVDNRVVTLDEESCLRVWNLDTFEVLREIPPETSSYPETFCALPDGRIATYTEDKVNLWNTATGLCETTYMLPDEVIGVFALPDSRLLCCANTTPTCTLHVYDTTTHTCTAVLEGHTFPTKFVQLLPDGRLASVATVDEEMFVWDLATGAKVGTARCNARITTLKMAGEWLVCGLRNGDLNLFDVSTFVGDLVEPVRTIHVSDTRILKVLGLPDSRIATICENSALQIWSLTTGEELAVLSEEALVDAPMQLLSDNTLAVGGKGGALELWDLGTYTCRAVLNEEDEEGEEDEDEEGDERDKELQFVFKVTDTRVLTLTWGSDMRMWAKEGMAG
jgi:WD40 repeat protein